jgi:dihydroflavonol-4-reductase
MEPDPSFWAGRRVCVTGGTGLLGYQLVRCLLGLGARVRVLALPPWGGHPLLREPAVELIFGDVRDPAVVRDALRGCGVVFHTAGVVAVWGPALRRVRQVHTAGTENVLGAADRGARVLVTSSVVAVGASRAPEVLDEESPFRLGRLKIDYVHAKRAAEEAALRSAEAGRDVVVTNPGYLVGPDDFGPSVMGRFCLRYWRGMVPVAPPGGVNLADVRDVAQGHLLAAERGRPGRRYILGGENRPFAAFMADLARAARMRPVITPVLPWWGLAALAACGECRSRLTGRHPYPSLQHARLNRYYWFYDSSRAARELGYTCRPLAETLADTFQWFAGSRAVEPRGASRFLMRPGAREAAGLDKAA